jgi:hypothetical protein
MPSSEHSQLLRHLPLDNLISWDVSAAPVVARDEWVAARREFLVKEKQFTRARDALSAQRRALPMVRIEKDYVFEGAAGSPYVAEPAPAMNWHPRALWLPVGLRERRGNVRWAPRAAWAQAACVQVSCSTPESCHHSASSVASSGRLMWNPCAKSQPILSSSSSVA